MTVEGKTYTLDKRGQFKMAIEAPAAKEEPKADDGKKKKKKKEKKKAKAKKYKTVTPSIHRTEKFRMGSDRNIQYHGKKLLRLNTSIPC